MGTNVLQEPQLLDMPKNYSGFPSTRSTAIILTGLFFPSVFKIPIFFIPFLFLKK